MFSFSYSFVRDLSDNRNKHLADLERLLAPSTTTTTTNDIALEQNIYNAVNGLARGKVLRDCQNDEDRLKKVELVWKLLRQVLVRADAIIAKLSGGDTGADTQKVILSDAMTTLSKLSLGSLDVLQPVIARNILSDALVIDVIARALLRGKSGDVDDQPLAMACVALVAAIGKSFAFSDLVQREAIFNQLNGVGLFKLVGDFALLMQQQDEDDEERYDVDDVNNEGNPYSFTCHLTSCIVRFFVGFDHGDRYNRNVEPPVMSINILNGMARNGLLETYFKLPPMFHHLYENSVCNSIVGSDTYVPIMSAKFVYQIVQIIGENSASDGGDDDDGREFSYKFLQQAGIGHYICKCLASVEHIEEWFGDLIARYEVVEVYAAMTIVLMFRGLGGLEQDLAASHFAGDMMRQQGGKEVLNAIRGHLREMEEYDEGYEYEGEEVDEDDEGRTLDAFGQGWSWATLLNDVKIEDITSTMLSDSETLPRLELCRKAWEDDHHGSERVHKNDEKWLISSGTMVVSILRECIKEGERARWLEAQRGKKANIIA